VVVGGIGAGALRQLSSSGIRTYRAVAGTVLDNLELIKSRHLPALTMDQTCAGHGPDGQCNH
jgi:predicted Fe-Mo cluster-binding NifX family protein